MPGLPFPSSFCMPSPHHQHHPLSSGQEAEEPCPWTSRRMKLDQPQGMKNKPSKALDHPGGYRGSAPWHLSEPIACLSVPHTISPIKDTQPPKTRKRKYTHPPILSLDPEDIWLTVMESEQLSLSWSKTLAPHPDLYHNVSPPTPKH